ncbi:MAG: response regulator [Planctomycetaceae bacterium]|nr:response regulator [Planctomycetaceae bacterium]
MKILVVDDSKAMRMIVIRTLKQTALGTFQTLEANNGAEALAVIAEHKPDLVLSDWNMPEMKGIDLLKSLRSSGNTTTFGFITSESSAEVRKEAEDAGASFLVTKPFTPNSFEAAISPVLA